MIQAVLFDVDDTLMDYWKAEDGVFAQMFAAQGKQATPEILEDLWQMSWVFWDRDRLSDTWDAAVQKEYHVKYTRSVRDFVAAVGEKYGLQGGADELYADYVRRMRMASTLYPDVLPILAALKEHYRLGVASNAIEEIQTARVTCLEPYLSHHFFSEQMGSIKPMREFFLSVCEEMQLAPSQCLMVGDSLTSDIAGARDVGMHTCWLNRGGRTNTGDIKPDWEIRTLEELPGLLKKDEMGESNDRF